MADRKASLIIELKDFVSSGIGKISAQLAVLRQGWMAVSSVVQTFIGALQNVLVEFMAQETAVNKLNIALKNQGIVSQGVTQDYIRFANEMQKTTVYADEQIIEMQALMATFGIIGSQMEKTTRLAMDLSSGLGIDLRTATLMLGKAFVGETGTLTRYGIVIDEAIPPAQRFAEVQRQINERFGGSAQAAAGTMAGKVAILKNAWSDFYEVVGAKVAPMLTKLLSTVTSIVTRMAELTGGTEKATGANAALEEQFRKNIKRQEEYLSLIRGGREGNEAFVATEEKKLESMKKALAIIEEKERKETDQVLRQAETRIIKERNDKIETENQKKELETRAKNFGATLAKIATMQTSHNKTLAAIGKASAITTATIDTYKGVGVAWSLGPILGPIMAAMVLAAGMANVAQIAGVKLAAGGMVMPRPGGTSAVVGEAGKAEAVVPLDDEQTKDKLRDTLGGSGVTVIIQAGAIVADNYSIDQFARKIDEKLFELGRNRRSYL